MILLQIFFWLAVAVPLYTYIGYPLTLVLLRFLLHRTIAKKPITPRLSLLIPAYNESGNIENKIVNSLALDYPAELFEIVIACDGSKDDTPVLAKRAAERPEAMGRVRVLDYPVNMGKIMVLNTAVKELNGDIIVFSDASAMLNPNALQLLVRNFADPDVGSVSGKYTVIKPHEVNIGGSEDFYWKYETSLKTLESSVSSTIGGHGHLHAIRRELYPFPPAGTINDDYIIHASVIAKGWRAAYEPEAVIREEAKEMIGFGRRIRIMGGNIQQLREIRPLLWPFRPLPVFFFICHKAFRLLVPFAMIVAFVLNIFLLAHPVYLVLFAGQVVFYVLALLGWRLRLNPKLLMIPYYFTMINAAAFLGVYYVLTGMKRMPWK